MVTIRRADRGDAAGLARLAEVTFRDSFAATNDPADMEIHCSTNFGTEIQLREIQSPSLVTILGDDDGELVAFAQLRLRSPIECVPAEHPSELYRLYVMKRLHGLGMAHELMREVLDTVRMVASDRIWLGVWERNERALAFYRKFGFEVVGDHVFQFGRDPQRDLIMALEVGATHTALTCSCSGRAPAYHGRAACASFHAHAVRFMRQHAAAELRVRGGTDADTQSVASGRSPALHRAWSIAPRWWNEGC